MSKKISEIFDVEPLPNSVSLPRIIDDENENEIETDASIARENIKSMLDVGNKALENAYDVAVQSESPRAYEVLSTMLKTMADINSQLLDIHEKKKRVLKQPEKIETPGSVTNNVAFIGTTSELNRLIMERMNKS
jgi:hypothetical protein